MKIFQIQNVPIYVRLTSFMNTDGAFKELATHFADDNYDNNKESESENFKAPLILVSKVVVSTFSKCILICEDQMLIL